MLTTWSFCEKCTHYRHFDTAYSFTIPPDRPRVDISPTIHCKIDTENHQEAYAMADPDLAFSSRTDANITPRSLQNNYVLLIPVPFSLAESTRSSNSSPNPPTQGHRNQQRPTPRFFGPKVPLFFAPNTLALYKIAQSQCPEMKE